MPKNEHEVRLNEFIKAYNELEEFKKPYTIQQDDMISHFTVPNDVEKLNEFVALVKKLEEARKNLNATSN